MQCSWSLSCHGRSQSKSPNPIVERATPAAKPVIHRPELKPPPTTNTEGAPNGERDEELSRLRPQKSCKVLRLGDSPPDLP